MDNTTKNEGIAGGISCVTRYRDKRNRPLQKPAPLKPTPVEAKRKHKILIRNNGTAVVKIPMPNDIPGSRWMYIQPKKEVEISFSDTGYFLMPWREIEYKVNNKIKLCKRKGYSKKDKDFTCTFLNEMDNTIALEVWPSDDNRQPVFCPRGLPVKRVYPATSYWAEYKSINFKAPEIVTVMDYSRPGMMKYEARPVVEKIKHDKKTLERIDALRREAALRSVGLNKP